jgi:hypothetical protein
MPSFAANNMRVEFNGGLLQRCRGRTFRDVISKYDNEDSPTRYPDQFPANHGSPLKRGEVPIIDHLVGDYALSPVFMPICRQSKLDRDEVSGLEML